MKNLPSSRVLHVGHYSVPELENVMNKAPADR